MNHAVESLRLFIAPAPRTVADIFSEADLARLRALGDVYIHEDGPVTDAIFDAHAAQADIVVGQLDLSTSREIFYPMSIMHSAFDAASVC
jgi:hypothetical protein